jgi:RNA polymerase sigma-70 factor, ECF subfamily
MKCSCVNPSDGTPSVTSTQLLRAAQERDEDAWQELVRTYSRRMYRWCRRAGLQPADAANVVQEAFASVARKLADFRRDRPGGTFRGWLRRIVENKIRDHFRRLGRQVDVPAGGTDAHCRLAETLQAQASSRDAQPGEGNSEGNGTATPPRASAEQAALGELVSAARREIGERDWKVFWRVAVDGQSAVEVGSEFGITANAVRLVKMRVLRRLRACLNDRVAQRE